VLDAVNARNPKAAEQAMRGHLRQTEEDLRAHLRDRT
jgi:DNA-binding GntR family transcriptional regulator